jgi:hypothetical protein
MDYFKANKEKLASQLSKKQQGEKIMKKKLICLFLSVMLMVSMLPLSVSASSLITWKNNKLATNYSPYNIIIGDDGSTYLASEESDHPHGIMKYKADGSLDTSFGTNGIVLDNNGAFGMCFDANGDILTGSQDGHLGLVRINHISGNSETLISQLCISGIARDSASNIYINTGSKLLKYSSSLAKIWEKNCASISAHPSSFEMGVLLLSDGSIVTTNRWLGTVQKYNINGDVDTSFGTNGSIKFSTTADKGIGFASYSDALYVACDEGFVKKVSDDGKDVTNVYTGNEPTVMVAKNGYYYIPSYSDKTITRFVIPGSSSTQESFSCTATPSHVSNNSAQHVSLNITSNSTQNYQVTAKVINKTSGDILNVQATTATLSNGKATVVLTPSSKGWPQGDYSIELCLSKTLGQSVISNTILTDTTISVSDNHPVITSQPQSLTVVGNQKVTLSITASGSGTLSYQWYKDGKAIAGATSSTYTITRAQSTDAGNYTVKISSSFGVIESNAAVVKVDFGNVSQKQVAGSVSTPAATHNPATGDTDSPFILAFLSVSSLAVLTFFSKKYFVKTIVRVK